MLMQCDEKCLFPIGQHSLLIIASPMREQSINYVTDMQHDYYVF